MTRRNESIKKVFSRVFNFVLSNLIDILILLVALVVLIICSSIFSVDLTENKIISIISYAVTTFLYGFPFYFVYFLKNKEFKMNFLKSTEGKSVNIKEAVNKHFRAYLKEELIILAVFYAVSAFIPFEISGKGIAFLFVSISFFYEVIPIQPLAALVWVAYVAVLYIICLVFAFKKWDKERLHR